MSIKSDDQKTIFIKGMLESHLANSSDPNALFAIFIAYDKVTKGSGGISVYEIAKIISEVLGKQVNISDSYQLVSEQWNKI